MGSKLILLSKVKVSKKNNPKRSKPKNTTEKKSHKKLSLAIWALAALALLLIIGKALSFLTSFYNPITPTFSSDKTLWSSQHALNVVVKTDALSLVSLDPSTKKLTVVKIPPDTYLELPKGYGSWPSRSIFDLGESENPPVGASLVKASVSQLLGVPVDGVILLSSTDPIEKVITDLRSNPLSLWRYVKGLKSDLAGVELYRIIKKIGMIRDDKTKVLNLAESSITESKLLADQSRVLGIDNIKLDLFVRDNLRDSIFANFDGNFAIYNGTTHPGLANRIAREITNLGGNVIFTGNSVNTFETSFVKSSKVGDEVLIHRLNELFAPHCLLEKCEYSDPKIEDSRAQINIIVGEDYYKRKTDRNYSF